MKISDSSLNDFGIELVQPIIKKILHCLRSSMAAHQNNQLTRHNSAHATTTAYRSRDHYK